MKEKGEFEQRPEVKPADQIPFSKPKASPLPWILCAVFAVIAIAAISFIILDKTNTGKKTDSGSTSKTSSSSSGGSSSSSKKKSPANPYGGDDLIGGETKEKAEYVEDLPNFAGDEKETKIVNLLKKIKRALYDNDYDTSYHSITTNCGLVYTYKEGYATSLEKCYALSHVENIPADFYSSLDWKKKDEMNAMIEELLKKEGFEYKSGIGDAEGVRTDGERTFLDKNNYYCSYLRDSTFVGITCGHLSWLSEEKKAMATELIDAEKAVSGYTGGMDVFWDSEDIEDSPVKPYQRLYARSATGFLLFFRESPNDKWVFIYGGNGGVPNCSELNITDDMKKAFESGTWPCIE